MCLHVCMFAIYSCIALLKNLIIFQKHLVNTMTVSLWFLSSEWVLLPHLLQYSLPSSYAMCDTGVLSRYSKSFYYIIINHLSYSNILSLSVFMSVCVCVCFRSSVIP